MLKEQVISQQFTISRRGTIKHFQLRLPRQAERVIAIEYGIRMISALPAMAQPATFVESLQFIPSRVMGELRLQHIGKSGLFFSSQIMERDAHLNYGDYSSTAGFIPQSWTHSAKREPIQVEIDREAPLLLGVYKDIVGEAAGQHLQYHVMIHLWFEAKEDLL